VGPPCGARMAMSWAWNSASVVSAMARDASVMHDHLVCEVVDARFGWFDKPIVYNNAGLVIDVADPGQFLAVFCQAHLAVNGVYPRALPLVWEEQDGFRDRLGCFYPTVRLVEDDCHVGWYRIVVFCHLLQRKQV
jgi:hypothetical protein